MPDSAQRPEPERVQDQTPHWSEKRLAGWAQAGERVLCLAA